MKKADLSTSLVTFLKNSTNPLIVILGPTASGKTDLSLNIAKEVNGEIISTDSRQIYREMRISTDVLLNEDRRGIPHHLIEIAKPDEELTMTEYRDLALAKIEEIKQKNHIPILVGGTGLYISSIIDNYKMPAIPPDKKLRKKLEEEAKRKGKEFVYAKLVKLDPEAAKSIHQNNLRYVIRAIEKANAPKSSKGEKIFDTYLVGIEWPRDQLYERVNLRVDLQLKRGLVNEVKDLLKKGYDENLPSMSSLGVKELIPYIRGEQTLEECIKILKQNPRHYAKRQMTWFRKYDNVHWLNPKDL